MRIDLRALALFLNVVVITSLTSWALMLYFGRRDNKSLRVRLILRPRRPFVPVSAQTDEGPKESRGKSERAPILNTLPSGEEDIRQYIARRSREWASTAKTR